MEYLHYKASEALSLKTEVEELREQEEEKIKQSTAIEIAKKMLKRGTDIEIIAEDTGLSHEQIQKLKANL